MASLKGATVRPLLKTLLPPANLAKLTPIFIVVIFRVKGERVQDSLRSQIGSMEDGRSLATD